MLLNRLKDNQMNISWQILMCFKKISQKLKVKLVGGAFVLTGIQTPSPAPFYQ
jgi:hypothetical protein